MKKYYFALSLFAVALIFLSSCAQEKTVPYVVLNRYFVKNDVDPSQLNNPVIDSKEKFDAIFGVGRVMGTEGNATTIDFDKQFVIAVCKPETAKKTELTPISLINKNTLIFKYGINEGDAQTFTSRPLLLIAVDKKYEANVSLEESKLK